eukprot:s2399_g6.t1
MQLVTILQERNFLGEWQAISDGIDLSFDLGSWTTFGSRRLHRRSQAITRTSSKSLTVRFCEFADVALFPPNDDSQFFKYANISIQHAALREWSAADGKPWHYTRSRKSPRSSSLRPRFTTLRPDPAPEPPALPYPVHETTDHASASSIPGASVPSGWQRDLWNLLHVEGSHDEVSGHLQMQLNSYFIDHHHHRHHANARLLRLDEDFQCWDYEIRQTWADWLDPAQPYDVVPVHPVPPHMAIADTIATVIVHQRLQPDRAASLTTAIVVDHPQPRYIEIAHSFPRLMMPSDIVQAAEVEPLCQQRLAQGYGACRLLVGLQDLRFDQFDDADRLWELAATHFDITSADVVHLFHVGVRPADLVQDDLECLLLQRVQDAPPVDFMRLVLIDIEYKADRRGPATHLRRQSKWLPRRITRESMIRMIGYDGHCAFRPDKCDVWHNGHYADFATDIMAVTNGDYIKLAVPEDPDNPDCTSPSEPMEVSNRTDDSSVEPLEDETSLAQFPHKTRTVAALPELESPACKLDEDSVIPGPEFEQPIHGPPDLGRPELRLGHHAECLDLLQTIWTHHAAVELEEEGNVLYISTWYSDPTRWPQCRASRPVRLLQDMHTWADRIAEAWDDRVDPDVILHIYMLTPQPRQNIWDSSVQPHVLLVQNPLAAVRSIHFSVVDVLRISRGVQQFVDLLPAQPDRDQVLHALHLTDVCHPHSETDCMVWFGDFELRGRYQLPLRDGNSLMVLYNNLAAEGITTGAASSTDPHSAAIGPDPSHMNRARMILFHFSRHAHT